MLLPEPDGTKIEVPREIYIAMKALAADERHAAALHFIIYQLCGRHRDSFVAGVPNASDTVAWLEGRRFVGERIARLIERPTPDAPEAPPPHPRTITEAVRRREQDQQE